MWKSFQRALLFSCFSSKLWRDYHSYVPCFVRWGGRYVTGWVGVSGARVDKRAARLEGWIKRKKCTVVEALVRLWLDQSLMFTHLLTEGGPVRKTSLLSSRKEFSNGQSPLQRIVMNCAIWGMFGNLFFLNSPLTNMTKNMWVYLRSIATFVLINGWWICCCNAGFLFLNHRQ